MSKGTSRKMPHGCVSLETAKRLQELGYAPELWRGDWYYSDYTGRAWLVMHPKYVLGDLEYAVPRLGDILDELERHGLDSATYWRKGQSKISHFHGGTEHFDSARGESELLVEAAAACLCAVYERQKEEVSP